MMSAELIASAWLLRIVLAASSLILMHEKSATYRMEGGRLRSAT